MKLYLRGKTWWIQANGNRISTGCTDEVAASLHAATYERLHVVLKALKTDPLLREHVETYIDDCRAAKATGYVYGLRAGDTIKIGFTSQSPEKRIRHLRVAQSLPLELVALQPGTRKDERDLHKQFRADRIRGEWFNANSPEILGWVKKYQYNSGIRPLAAGSNI